MNNPRVFISYAHESDEYRKSILELAVRLRKKGVHVVTDHLYEYRPPENGWQAWMMNEIEQADVVLVACTKRKCYSSRFRRQAGREKGVGREGAIITQALYDSKSYNTKYKLYQKACRVSGNQNIGVIEGKYIRYH